MLLNIRIQWNAGTACVSECVVKMLACRGLRVGPSKDTCMKFLGINKCKIYMLVTCRQCFQLNNVSFSSTMVGDFVVISLE